MPPEPVTIRGSRPFVTGVDPRESLAELGYAFLPGALERERLEELRLRFLGYLADAGWLAAGSDPALAAPGPVAHDDADPDYLAVYRRIQSTQAYHELGHDPSLVGIVERILGEPALCLPCKMARVKFPRAREDRPPTPAHQDYGHIQGSVDTLTAWVPLEDTPAGQGRLAVAAGSHRLGLRHVPGRFFDPTPFELDWHAGDFAAGDVIVFHSLAIHAAEDNPSDHVRITVDFRYQPVAEPVNALMLEPHFLPGSWDELYAGWTNAGLRRYWERLPLELEDETLDPPELGERTARKRSRFVSRTVVEPVA